MSEELKVCKNYSVLDEYVVFLKNYVKIGGHLFDKYEIKGLLKDIKSLNKESPSIYIGTHLLCVDTELLIFTVGCFEFNEEEFSILYDLFYEWAHSKEMY